MATKDLARTVIEGGQRLRNKIERRTSARSLRTETRAYLSGVRLDPDAADGVPPPMQTSVYPAFDDKLNPAYRFLDSRVGKGWNNTLALLAQRFDTRTIPGRHVVHDHILRDVAPSRGALAIGWRTRHYFIDGQGVLRNARPRRSHDRPTIVFDRAAVVGWLAGRKVGRLGACLFWYVAVRDAGTIRVTVASQHIVFTYTVAGAKPDEPMPPFRQGRALAKADVAFFEGLPPAVQEALLRLAPVAPARPRK